MGRKLREENGVRLPARVWRVIDGARGGKKVCKFLRKMETGDTDITYAFEPTGRRIPTKSAMAAIESGLLRPMGDGLFGEETSQTWVAA